ncbi:cytochrome c1 [Sideroxydans lithotrophicus]|uniref:Cytochrome c1 n=1 Tax=Sideroxydans lithotrophicus (strain ES-1) TaxID=580332 RepID=D5CU39_SIDLE|nr:cytochrome c1 [Sideroxydans lithotrophicus]ADE10374.1 cytochrome c1 [Sideroxydans lithotrophicus ES-1]
MKKLITILASCCIATSVMASEAELETVKVGNDAQTLERGIDGFMTNCHSCHSLKYVKFRNLVEIGIDKAKVDAWRADQPLESPIMSQMSESDAAQAFGKAPPDLSLMTSAREGGVNYVYSYLLGYYVTPEGLTGNHYYPPTKMPDILGMSMTTDAAKRTEIQGTARNIVSFLNWAADPHAGERIRLGYYVIAYLIVLTTLLYFVKKQVWSKLK